QGGWETGVLRSSRARSADVIITPTRQSASPPKGAGKQVSSDRAEPDLRTSSSPPRAKARRPLKGLGNRCPPIEQSPICGCHHHPHALKRVAPSRGWETGVLRSSRARSADVIITPTR